MLSKISVFLHQIYVAFEKRLRISKTGANVGSEKWRVLRDVLCSLV